MSKSNNSANRESGHVLPKEELEINLEELAPPVPPDGGWAWMVLLGSVMCMFFVDGLSFSFGVLLSDLQESFDTSKTKMSLAGSLIVGFTLISGPIVSAMSNQFSMRSLVVGGGLVSTLSLIACCFVYNVEAFIVLFGFITGVSFGFIYLPAATVVSQWFHKRRATATGISMCGSSIGSTLYSLFIPYLVRAYTWRGCMAILAAVSLNCVAAGLFFIDLRAYQKLHPVKNEPEGEGDGEPTKPSNEALGVEPPAYPKPWRSRLSNSLAESPARFPEKLPEEAQESTENDLKERGDSAPPQQAHAAGDDKESRDIFGTATLPGTPVMGAIVSRTADQISANKLAKPDNSFIQSITIPVRAERLKVNANGYHAVSSHDRRVPVLTLETVNRIAGAVLSSSHEGSHRNVSGRPLPRRRCVSARHHSPTPPPAVEPTTKASVYIRRGPVGQDMLFASAVSLRPTTELGVPVNREMRRKIVQKLERELDLPVHRKDFFYSGSMIRINEYVSSQNVNEYVRTVTSAAETSGETNYMLRMLRELFDFSLFSSPTFILLITSSVFGLIGYPVPYVFLKDNAQNLGYSAEDSSNLLVYLCALNTIGRVLAGVISDRPCTDALFVNNAALITSGVACIILPLATSYAGQVSFAATYGLAIAAFASLRIILLVEMLGLDRLTNAFGFLLLFQGLAFMASPPILAGFYDMLQSFDYTFILAGCSLIISAVLCFPLRPILRWEKRRRGEPVPPTNGGGCFTRLLRRIRDQFRRRQERLASCDVA